MFGALQAKKRYGVIIDIGSGSVLTAIVLSDPDQPFPLAIWSHREHAPLRNIESVQQSAKSVMASLMNAAMLLDSQGKKALKEFDKKAKVTELQCTIAAPWSYTVTKTLNYQEDEEFLVDDDLFKDLLKSLKDKMEAELQSEKLAELDLEVTTKLNLPTRANGYRVENILGNKATNLNLAQLDAAIPSYISESISEMQEKMFPDTKVKKLSFALLYFSVMKHMLPQTQDTCMVDVTYEATEIGVVRDGSLMHCSHIPFGIFSLAREISAITKAPLHESFAQLHAEKPYEFIKSLPDKQQEEVSAVFESYTEKVSELFKETGDALAIPRHITLHTEIKTEPLLQDTVEQAVKRNLKTEPFVVPISQKIIDEFYSAMTDETQNYIPSDTALLLSAQFFHTKGNGLDFEYF